MCLLSASGGSVRLRLLSLSACARIRRRHRRGTTRRRDDGDGGGVRGARMRVHVTRFAQTSWSRFYQASISNRNSTRGRGRVSSYSECPRKSRDHRPSVRPSIRVHVCRGRAHACTSDTRGCAPHVAHGDFSHCTTERCGIGQLLLKREPGAHAFSSVPLIL